MESVDRRPELWIVAVVILVVAALGTIGVLAWMASDPGDPVDPPPSTSPSSTASTSTSPSSGPGPTSGPSSTLPDPGPPKSPPTQEVLAIPRTSTTRAARSRPTTTRASVPSTEAAREPSGPTRSIGASAYCLRGRMANGRPVHDGAVASVVLPMGTRWRVIGSTPSGRSLVGRVFEVEDTGGPRATFDVWVASCGTARQIGRPRLEIEQA